MIRFTNARLLKYSENGFTVQNGVLETDGNVITVSGEFPSENIPERTIDLKGKGLIIPGFKNAHTHSAMTFLRSYADDMPLDKWLTEQVFPMEARLDGEYIRKFARLAFLEYLRNGITACFDMYVEPDAMAKAAEETGMRLVMCGTVNDFKDSPELLEDFYLRFNGHSELVSYKLGFHAEYTTSEKILVGIARLSEKYSAPVFTHCSETAKEVAECIGRHGLTPPAYFEKLGLLEYGGGFFHSVHVTDEDLEIMKKRNVYAVINPSSNAKLASGIAPVSRLLRTVRCGIGTDGPASNNALDMFREMYLAAVLPKLDEKDAAAVSAEDILYAAVSGGGEVMGLKGLSLEAGMAADIAVIDLDSPNMLPENNIPKNIVYSGNPSNIILTMINGKILYENGVYTLPGISSEDILNEAKAAADKIFCR